MEGVDDPGTIYSDDDIDNFSDDNAEEDEREIAKNRIAVKKADSFFEDLFSSQKYLDEGLKAVKENKSSLGDVTKYMDNKKSHDLDATIEKVRTEHKFINIKKLSGCKNTDGNNSEEESDSLDENKEQFLTDRIKVKERDFKKKEKKKQRKTEQNEQLLQKEKEQLSFEDAPQARVDATFLEMNLSTPLLKAISKMGYEHPTPIQGATIPVALKGRDICGCAATGTGKTAAFMLPIIQRLMFRSTKEALTRVLVLVPTRELGVQVYDVTRELAQFTNLNISLTVGGLNMNTQTKELLENPDIIIATPGRLIDHIHNTPSFSLREIEILVLDEADRMLDEYFVEQLKEIIRQCCVTRQTMLFSATMTSEVKDLVAVSLKNPVRVFVNNNTDVAQNLRQEFIKLKKGQREELRLAVLAYLLTHSFTDKCIVFVTRKSECHRLHIILGLLGIRCGELHGDLKQNERLESLQNFKDQKINVLLATDVAARGLDIKGVQTVINYTVPDSYKTYVHRVGRTARAGFSGRSVTIAFASGDDYSMLRIIQKHSLTPLYERIVKSSNVDRFSQHIAKLEPAIEKVLTLEKEEKSMVDASKKLDNLKTKLTKDPKKISEADKPQKRTWFQTKDEIKSEKERLKLIIEGRLTGRALKKLKAKNNNNEKQEEKVDKNIQQLKKKTKKKKKKPDNDISSLSHKSTENINKRQTLLHSGIPEYAAELSNKRKSNFFKELTSTDPETVKRLKRGPSYDEKKEHWEKKNPGQKFKMEKLK